MFQPVFIKATNIDDAWHQLLYNAYEYGREYEITDGSFKGHKRLEFDYAAGFISAPHTEQLAPMMPEGSNLPRPTDDDAIKAYFANYLMDPTLGENEHYKYSNWINGTNHYKDYAEVLFEPVPGIEEGLISIPNKVTPIEWVIYHFQTKGYGNNHCYINIGNADSGFAYENSYQDECARGTSPCLRGVDFKIKDGKLITAVTFRSWDLYAGFPENMGGFALLNQYVASYLDGVEPGPLCFSSAGLHCYDFQVEIVKTRLNK